MYRPILFQVLLFGLTLIGMAEPGSDKIVNHPWPSEWVVFGPLPPEVNIGLALQVAEIPQSLTFGNTTYLPLVIKAHQGKIDLLEAFRQKAGFQEIQEKAQALIYAKFNVEESGHWWAGAGADWWMSWTLDGRELVSTLKDGNGTGEVHFSNHSMRTSITKGQHVLAAVIKSGSGGWTVHSNGSSEDARRELTLAEALQQEKARKDSERDLRKKKNSRLKVAIFGSSVAKGYGAEGEWGWANRWGDILKSKNWDYVNKSIGGDTTSKLLARIDTDLLAEHPDIAVIGLSLANEGLREKEPLEIYKGYVKNLKKIVQILRKNGIIPIISNGYPHGSYTEKQYDYVQKFNEELATWPVYSIDLMGAMDNGHGRWLKGYYKDAGHPNSAGHEELTRAVPTSLLDSLISAEPRLLTPTRQWNNLKLGQSAGVLECQADRTLHSYTLGFEVLLPLAFKPALKLSSSEHWELVADPKGKLICKIRCPQGEAQVLEVDLNGERELFVAIVYSYGREELSLVVNGKFQTLKMGQIESQGFKLIGSEETTTPVEFRNAFLVYSAMSKLTLEQMAKTQRVPQSSLALYAPLDDAVFVEGMPLINLAPTELRWMVLKN